MSGMKKWEPLKLSFEKIKEVTNDFEKPIGKGGYGSVFEGDHFFDGKYTKVAVKRLNDQSHQGLKEFLTEIDLLFGQQHPNIITLVGYCDEGKEKMIVYEYAEHGSLDKYIRRTDNNYTLNWVERLKIVVDAARGLDHLHNHVGGSKSIIHRDIKCANILLDHNWVAKISDLGLSKLTFSGLDRSTVISDACGTPSYVEPEYIKRGFVSKKSDVYSFGMVLFEVLCGRLCNIRDNDGVLLLAEVAKEYYAKNKLDIIIDPILREQMSPNSYKKFSEIAYNCLQDREQRPPIEVVKNVLEEMLRIQIQHEEMVKLKSLFISYKEDMIEDEHYWRNKLPHRYQRYIQRSDKPLQYNNKKDIYIHLCEGFLCDNGKMWVSLCPSNNRICSMLPATEILSDDIKNERLDSESLNESRFPKVKVLGYASSYSFTCTLQLQMFSPHNEYACYLVFKFKHNKMPDDNRLFIAEYGLGDRLLGKVLVHMNVTEGLELKHDGLVYDVESHMVERKDGWMEVMLTKPLDGLEDHLTLKIWLSVQVGSFRGIIVEGIEFRPYVDPYA